MTGKGSGRRPANISRAEWEQTITVLMTVLLSCRPNDLQLREDAAHHLVMLYPPPAEDAGKCDDDIHDEMCDCPKAKDAGKVEAVRVPCWRDTTGAAHPKAPSHAAIERLVDAFDEAAADTNADLLREYEPRLAAARAALLAAEQERERYRTQWLEAVDELLRVGAERDALLPVARWLVEDGRHTWECLESMKSDCQCGFDSVIAAARRVVEGA